MRHCQTFGTRRRNFTGVGERTTFVVDGDDTIRVDRSDIDVMGCP